MSKKQYHYKFPSYQKVVNYWWTLGELHLFTKRNNLDWDYDYSSNQEIQSTILKGSFVKEWNDQFSYF